MNKTGLFFFALVISVGVLYVSSMLYTAYFFEHDFKGVQTQGSEAKQELQFWLGQPALALNTARGFRFKRGVPPTPVFFYAFEGNESALAQWHERYQPRRVEKPLYAVKQVFTLPGAPPWWNPEDISTAYYFFARTANETLLLTYDPKTQRGLLQVNAR